MAIPTEQEPLREAPAGELFRRLLADVRLMIDRQAELAKLELEEKASSLREAGILIAAAAVLAVFVVGVLIAGAVLTLAIVVPAWAAAFVVGAVLAAVAAALFLVGRARMRSVGSLAPREAIEAAREDVRWIRRESEQLRSTE